MARGGLRSEFRPTPADGPWVNGLERGILGRNEHARVIPAKCGTVFVSVPRLMVMPCSRAAHPPRPMRMLVGTIAHMLSTRQGLTASVT